jgi:uncharacterized protein (TIGR02246 family)
MNVRTLKTVSLLSVILIAAACTGGTGSAAGDASKGAATAGPVNDPAVRAAIDSADRQFAVAFKAGDAATAASFYEQDAVSAPPNTDAQSGRAAIEKGLAGMFKDLGKLNDFTVTTKNLDIYPDHAIEVGSYEMSFTPAGAKDAMKDHGTFMNYWRKQSDGSWKIHRDAIVSATPMPSMTPPTAAKKK